MTKSLILVLGGARSGKSSHAEMLAAAYPEVLYVATAEAWDDEMSARIAAHRAQRPAHWRTLEAAHSVGDAIAGATAASADAAATQVVLLDCLTLLANNVIITLADGASEADATSALMAEVDGLLAAYNAAAADWIIVSNEVGLGIVPAYPLGRIYRDALGRANQRLAAQADRVILMVAGIPMFIKTTV